jgi:hypothetical protein
MSNHGMLRGLQALLIILAFAVALAPTALAQRLIINGHEVSLEQQLLGSDRGLLAPVAELARYLGAEAVESGLGISVRWGASREARLPQEKLRFIGGEAYFPLAELAEILGARLLDFTDSIYLFPLRSELSSLSYADGTLRLGFTRLAPLVLTSSGRRVELRFYNSVLAIASRTSRYSQGPLEELELSSEEPDRLVLKLKLREAAKPLISTGFAGGGYWVKLGFAASEVESSSATLRLTPWISYYRREWRTVAGRVRVDYLLVKDYQAHYRLKAAIPQGGLGESETLEEMVQAQGGAAGINANFFNPDNNMPIGLVIKDGVLRSPAYGRRAALGIDPFGQLVIFQEGAQPPFIPLRDAVSAGPLLLKDGKIVLDPRAEGFSEAFAKARAARSAVGITPDGDLVMLVVPGGAGSAGLTLEELVGLLQELGAADGLALDGGSSASLVFRRGKSLHSVGNRGIAVGLVLIPR